MENLKITDLLAKTAVGDSCVINGDKHKVVRSKNGCTGCSFLSCHADCAVIPACTSQYRKDDTPVIFVVCGKRANTTDADVLKSALIENGEPFLIVKTVSMRIGNKVISPGKAEFEIIPMFGGDHAIKENGERIGLTRKQSEKLIALGIHTEHTNGYGSIYDFFKFKEAMEKAKQKRGKLISIVAKL